MARAEKGAEKEQAPSVKDVYLHVVEDVIRNVRNEFDSEGLDENILQELRLLWELKLNSTAAFQISASFTPLQDLNVPFEATDEYQTQTPTVDMLFPPTPPALTPAPDVRSARIDGSYPAFTSSGEPIMYQYTPRGPSAPVAGADGGLDVDTKPASFMKQPAAWMTRKPSGVDVNIDINADYDEGHEEEESRNGHAPVTKDLFNGATGKRKREDSLVSGNSIPQRDGAGDNLQIQEVLVEDREGGSRRLDGRNSNSGSWKRERFEVDTRLASLKEAAPSLSGSSLIPQCDGVADDYNNGVVEEDYNEPGEEELQPVKGEEGDSGSLVEAKAEEGDSGDGEPPLGEDDDEPDAYDEADDEAPTENLVLAKFDKVSKTKSKWKCILIDGIMHLKNKDHPHAGARDILFAKAFGDFEF